MKKDTQINRIINKLNKDGFITRNECLRNYISRLGAHIATLKKAGWDFEAGSYKQGHDYIYRVRKSPFKKVIYKVGERTIETYAKN